MGKLDAAFLLNHVQNGAIQFNSLALVCVKIVGNSEEGKKKRKKVQKYLTKQSKMKILVEKKGETFYNKVVILQYTLI